MELTREQMENLKSFLLETFAFTEEQNDAMDKQIPMTQEIFESIVERCNELGSAADKIFYRIIMEYPDMTDIYGGKIAKELELDTKYGGLGQSLEKTQFNHQHKKDVEHICSTSFLLVSNSHLNSLFVFYKLYSWTF